MSRTKENVICKGSSNDVRYVKGLPDEDTTKWIARDIPIDLDRLLQESKISR